MPDLNSDALGIWEHLKPAIDKEIEQKTRGMVQRRKMKVTTAPSISTGTIGVTEAFGTTEMVIPFATNLISATVGDMVWVEFMYGATNAFASMFASADEKDWDVAGDLTVHGVLDVTKRRCEATLPTSGNGVGWYRAIVYNAYDTSSAQGTSGEIVTIKIVYTSAVSVQHEISLFMTKGKVAFLNETSHGTTNLVDQIRYNYNGSTGYIDIHWTTTTACYVNVSFDVASRNYAQERWVAGTLTSVADSPANETELVRYTFAADTITDISSNFALNTSGISGLTGKIHAIYDASSGLVHLSFSAYTASTTFGTSTPIFTCSNSRYAPKATTSGNGMIRMNNGEWYPYEVSIGTTGNIFQALTSSATRVYGQITYPV